MLSMNETITQTDADTWTALKAEHEALGERLEVAARPLERAAHALLNAEHRYSRTGMYPELRELGSNGAFEFHCSNGIDYGDDFWASFTFEQLQADPEAVGARHDREQRQRELKRLRFDRKRLNSRIKEMEAGK